MADLSVNIGELQMKNPVMTASGTFGYGEEFSDFIDITACRRTTDDRSARPPRPARFRD